MRFNLKALLCSAIVSAVYAYRRRSKSQPIRIDADPLAVTFPPIKIASPPGQIATTTTSADKRIASGDTISWSTSAELPPAEAISLHPAITFQEIVGFGAAFTDAACYMFNQLNAEARQKLFYELFHPTQTALNLCRTCIGSSDYATHAYSYADGPADPQLTSFSIGHDLKYIVPMIREARLHNPDMFLFSSPWSPPGWMKSNGSLLGGNVQRKWMPHYAQYLLKFLQAYGQAGVPISAITVQNEVDTDQDSNMPQCSWPQEYEVDFVRYHLGPTLEKAGQKTQIWMIDHNFNLWGRALASLEEWDIKKYVRAIAWHGYVGDPAKATVVHDAHPDIDAYWTEGGPGFDDPNYGLDWTVWGRSFTSFLRNWCRGLTGWNLALDEAGKPNIGPFNCGGLVTINSVTKDVSYSGQFWALSQFSRFVRRGARRFQSLGEHKDLVHVAFQNPDGSKVLVLTNSGSSRTISLDLDSWRAQVQLEPNSLTTLVWN